MFVLFTGKCRQGRGGHQRQEASRIGTFYVFNTEYDTG